MSDIKTVTLDGGELKVESLNGQNTIIVNRGTATLYASIDPDIVPDGDNVAAIPTGGAMNLHGTNGTVYLLGTGKAQLTGTDVAWLPMSSGGSSGGSNSTGGVSQEYVDNGDSLSLQSAKKYTDNAKTSLEEKINEVRGEIPDIPNKLPADGGNAETAEKLATARTINGVAFDGSKNIEIDAVTTAELSDLKGYIGYTDSDIYGLEADFENNKFTRLAGAVGKSPGTDFDSVRAFGGRRRCAVTDNGDVMAYYGDDNYEEDGLINSTETFVQTMVEQPKFYYKMVPLKIEKIDGADGYHLRKARYYISDTPKAGFKVHPAFVQNGREVDKIYLSAFEGAIRSAESGRLNEDEQIANFDTDVLISTTNVKPASGTTQALTRDNARKLAQNRGEGWGITTIETLSATQLLFMIEYATFNSQSAIGNGVVNATAPINTGSTSSLGNTSGSVASGGVSYRGEENLWGNMWTFIDGLNIYKFEDATKPQKIYIADNNFVEDGINASYEETNISPLSGSGFISAFGYSSAYDWLFFPVEANGNTSLPIGDVIDNGSAPGWKTHRIGGAFNDHSKAGLYAACPSNNYTSHNNTIGARLIYIPQPETATQEVTSND